MKYLSERYAEVYRHKGLAICVLKKAVPADGDNLGYCIDSAVFAGQVFNDIADAVEAINKSS